MAILPIDLQALLVRMGDVSKIQQLQQEGLATAQMLKGGELSELARIESSRVNEVKPHPDGNSKIEDEQKKEKKAQVPSSMSEEGKKKKKEQEKFEEPYKGTIIDTKR